MKITTVKDNRMHNGRSTRSPVIIYRARMVHLFIWVCVLITMAFYHRTERGMNSTHLHSGLRIDYNGILPSHCTGRAWCTFLFGSAHWFTTASYRRFWHATVSTNVSRGRQASSCTSASMQLPPSRGMLFGPDRSGCVAYGRDKRIDRRQPQHARGAQAGMRDQSIPPKTY